MTNHEEPEHQRLRLQLDSLASPRELIDEGSLEISGVRMGGFRQVPPLDLHLGLERVGEQLVPSVIQQLIFEQSWEKALLEQQGRVVVSPQTGLVRLQSAGKVHFALPYEVIGTHIQCLEYHQLEGMPSVIVDSKPYSFVWDQNSSRLREFRGHAEVVYQFGDGFGVSPLQFQEGVIDPLFQAISPGKFLALELIRRGGDPAAVGYFCLREENAIHSPEVSSIEQRAFKYYVIFTDGTAHNISSLVEEGSASIEFLATKFVQAVEKMSPLISDPKKLFRLFARHLGLVLRKEGNMLCARSRLCQESEVRISVKSEDETMRLILEAKWRDPHLPKELGLQTLARTERVRPSERSEIGRYSSYLF